MPLKICQKCGTGFQAPAAAMAVCPACSASPIAKPPQLQGWYRLALLAPIVITVVVLGSATAYQLWKTAGTQEAEFELTYADWERLFPVYDKKRNLHTDSGFNQWHVEEYLGGDFELMSREDLPPDPAH